MSTAPSAWAAPGRVGKVLTKKREAVNSRVTRKFRGKSKVELRDSYSHWLSAPWVVKAPRFIDKNGKSQQMGKYSYLVRGKTLRFDLEINKAYRRMGMYSYLMAQVLSENPGVNRIPSQLGHDNIRSFLKATFGTPAAYKKFFEKPEFRSGEPNPAQVRELRKKVIDGLLATPAFKVRNELGFSNVRSIYLGAYEDKALGGRVIADIEKGTLRKTAIHVFYRSPKGKVFELRNDGTAIPAKRADYTIKDYRPSNF